VQLLGLRQEGDAVLAEVKVSEPGLSGETTLLPSFHLGDSEMLDRPMFPGTRFQLGLEEVNLNAQSARLNIEAPGTGLLENRRTLLTFLAAIVGFTALFVWMLQIRATLLGVAWKLEQREGIRA
jgi:heme exporter protein C